MTNVEDDLTRWMRRGGTIRTVHSPPDLTDSIGRQARPDGKDAPMCHERYGRWVPGGDGDLALEDIVDRFIAGVLSYDTAVRLTEAITDAVGNPTHTKRDLLTVLARKREAHHGHQR